MCTLGIQETGSYSSRASRIACDLRLHSLFLFNLLSPGMVTGFPEVPNGWDCGPRGELKPEVPWPPPTS